MQDPFIPVQIAQWVVEKLQDYSTEYRAEKEELKNDMDLAYNIYHTLAQKLKQDRVQERTPVYQVI